MRPIDNYYLNQEDPIKGTLLALKEIILSFDVGITEEWKYKMPFFYYKGKMLCYLWKDKKSNNPYIGIVDGYKINHPLLERGNRTRVKILRINPSEDLPIHHMEDILKQSVQISKTKNRKS